MLKQGNTIFSIMRFFFSKIIFWNNISFYVATLFGNLIRIVNRVRYNVYIILLLIPCR